MRMNAGDVTEADGRAEEQLRQKQRTSKNMRRASLVLLLLPKNNTSVSEEGKCFISLTEAELCNNSTVVKQSWHFDYLFRHDITTADLLDKYLFGEFSYSM